jgi:hypothetical protein
MVGVFLLGVSYGVVAGVVCSLGVACVVASGRLLSKVRRASDQIRVQLGFDECGVG